MSRLNKAHSSNGNQKIQKRKLEETRVDEIMRENLELMNNIQKNRASFCELVGGC